MKKKKKKERMRTVTACDGYFNNYLEIHAQCDGCDGCEGISRCVTTFYKNKDFVVNSVNNKNIQNIETHMEMPSHPSHPHIRAQYNTKAILLPSHPSHHSVINEVIETGLDFILSHFD